MVAIWWCLLSGANWLGQILGAAIALKELSYTPSLPAPGPIQIQIQIQIQIHFWCYLIGAKIRGEKDYSKRNIYEESGSSMNEQYKHKIHKCKCEMHKFPLYLEYNIWWTSKNNAKWLKTGWVFYTFSWWVVKSRLWAILRRLLRLSCSFSGSKLPIGTFFESQPQADKLQNPQLVEMIADSENL